MRFVLHHGLQTSLSSPRTPETLVVVSADPRVTQHELRLEQLVYGKAMRNSSTAFQLRRQWRLGYDLLACRSHRTPSYVLLCAVVVAPSSHQEIRLNNGCFQRRTPPELHPSASLFLVTLLSPTISKTRPSPATRSGLPEWSLRHHGNAGLQHRWGSSIGVDPRSRCSPSLRQL